MVDGRLIRSPRRTPRRGAEKRAYPQGQWSDERTSSKLAAFFRKMAERRSAAWGQRKRGRRRSRQARRGEGRKGYWRYSAKRQFRCQSRNVAVVPKRQ